ncbi:MAG: serine hydrolase [Eubacteriales bacterium]|nr:serine hydrolase [Eubacteriales bacterium]
MKGYWRCAAVLLAVIVLLSPGVTAAAEQTADPAFTVVVTEPPLTGTEEDANEEVTDAQKAQEEAALSTLQDDGTLSAQQKLDALFKRFKTLGACVCVIENGAITHTYCYGIIKPKGDAITPETMFRVGSISKMVTAMGIMRLVEDGYAELDEDLSELIGETIRNPYYPDAVLTLRQLMTHTAGLRDSGYYRLAVQGKGTPLNELLGKDSRSYLFYQNGQPGTTHEYSNFGGGLLGVIIENLTGQTVDEYMNQTIFEPLGITAGYQGELLPADATVSDTYAMPSKRKTSSVREDGWAKTVPEPMLDYVITAGKLTISAPDLAKLLIVLCDGGVYGDTRLLKESTVTLMRTPQNGIGSVTGNSDWGLNMIPLQDVMVEGRTMYGHGGKANGMLCTAYFDPTDRTGVVMLTNGCNNRPVSNDVGLLSLLTVRLCYSEWIDDRHVTEDPWLVTK